jgi:hypothetical protein
MRIREKLKRSLPNFVLGPLQSLRRQMASSPLEEIVLHEYQMEAENGDRPRLTLVIPSIAPEKTFGGVLTGIDIFLEIGKRTGADLRILLDEVGPIPAGNCIASRANKLGVPFHNIEIVPRLVDTPRIAVRSSDVFLSYNWWTTLNVQGLIKQQAQYFGKSPNPLLYLIQEYEPFFYAFSSTHMSARQAFDPPLPCWGIFNSNELFAYFSAQGHKLERYFVFEPQLNGSLEQFLERSPRPKQRRILVYGRPTVARNCYPAVEKGLRAWAVRYPEFSTWEVLSAGLSHSPLALAPGRVMKSAGKLTLEDYGELLLTTAAGLSLMSSPHPSYPPLEMSHFGLWTVTNNYTDKDMSQSHENIISIQNIAPDTIADALAKACSNYESDPESGWRGKSLRPSFLETRPFAFLDQLASELQERLRQ